MNLYVQQAWGVQGNIASVSIGMVYGLLLSTGELHLIP